MDGCLFLGEYDGEMIGGARKGTRIYLYAVTEGGLERVEISPKTALAVADWLRAQVAQGAGEEPSAPPFAVPDGAPAQKTALEEFLAGGADFADWRPGEQGVS